ncbi:MAG: sigma-70 family RNA polymerase sigma factor [Ilumatobacteraceae bacterium]
MHRGEPVSRSSRRDHAGRLTPFVTLRCIATLDDAKLVTAAQSGDRGALDQLLRRHYDRVHAVCRRITGSASDADDACQEALIKIVRNLPRFDGRSSFGTWAYRIATNASLDELRKRQRRPSLRVVDDGDADRDANLVDRAATGRFDQVDDQLEIDAALETLSDDFRVVVVLRDVVDLDYQEIADVLDIPLGTVKSRIARARSQLADTLRVDLLPPLRTLPDEQHAATPDTGGRGFSDDPGNFDDDVERPNQPE